MIDVNDSYDVAAAQRKLLSMLKDFHQFCVGNEINYSIIGGTLLGAIRDKGFIPWDADVDVVMNRENYDKLMKVVEAMGDYTVVEKLWVPKVVEKKNLVNGEIPDGTPVVDIFIVDRVPAGGFSKKAKLLELKVLQGMMKTKKNEKKKFSAVTKAALAVTSIMGKAFSMEKKQKMYTSVSMRGNKDTSRPLMICNDVFRSLGCEYDSHLMDEYTLVNFEDTQLMTIKNWENYLIEQYGDYMTPVRM